jgi:hypothetical protein
MISTSGMVIERVLGFCNSMEMGEGEEIGASRGKRLGVMRASRLELSTGMERVETFISDTFVIDLWSTRDCGCGATTVTMVVSSLA